MTKIMNMTTTADNDVPFCVHILQRGDRYGADNCLTWEDDEPGVEFYDGRYSHTYYGQFVARYYLSSILYGTSGLRLYGGVPEWQIDAKTMDGIRGWLVAMLDKREQKEG